MIGKVKTIYGKTTAYFTTKAEVVLGGDRLIRLIHL